MKTVIKTYRHKKNHNKYIEVHSDGYGHHSVVQYMYWAKTNVMNKTGDGCLHRWRKSSLQMLLESYDLYAIDGVAIELCLWFFPNYLNVKKYLPLGDLSCTIEI